MYLVDTDVISESRKGAKANAGVQLFFESARTHSSALLLSAVTIGELRRVVDAVRHRGEKLQSQRLERWLNRVTREFANAILPIDHETAQIWGRLSVPNHENSLEKQIAAIALIHDLTVVTRNIAGYTTIGVKTLNPFS